MPLRSAAVAFSAFAGGAPHVDATLLSAARRLIAAVAEVPSMIAGRGRFCSAIAAVTKGRVLAKVGAEGFFGAFDAQNGLGLALHVDDGSSLAAERLCAHLLFRHGAISQDRKRHAEHEAVVAVV